MDQHLWFVVLGLFAGAFGALAGVGGGFIIMPVLLLLCPGKGPDLLTSMSLAVIFFNSLFSSLAYARVRRIEYRSGLSFSAASIPGSILGSLTTSYIPRHTFDVIFGILMISISIYLLLYPRAGREKREEKDYRTGNISVGTVLSFVIGYISTLLGIGGGVIYVPVMIYLLKFPVLIATSTSLFVLMVNSLTATIVHASTGVLFHEVHGTISLILGGICGTGVGVWLSGRIQEVWIVRILSLALLATGFRILAGF